MIDIFRVNDLIDLPVVDSFSAQRVSTVKDVIIDMRENKISSLVCRQKLFRQSMDIIPFKYIATISQNSVVVTSTLSQISPRRLSAGSWRLQSYQHILGKLVLSPRGETVGVIRDLIIDNRSGIIIGYELSEGYLDDLLRGRHIMELECGNLLSGKNLILKEQCDRTWYSK